MTESSTEALASEHRYVPSQSYRFYRRVRRRLLKLAFGEPIYLDRAVLYPALDKLTANLDFASMDGLEISGDRWGSKGFKSYRSLFYPTYDVCAEPYGVEAFDFIVAEQVFQTLPHPGRAAGNVHAMLRPGGYFLISTPFIQKRMDEPVDCNRWTALGMRYLLHEAGFALDRIDGGSWGTKQAAIANMDAYNFPYYNPLLHDLKRNDPTFPVQVWALARKD